MAYIWLTIDFQYMPNSSTGYRYCDISVMPVVLMLITSSILWLNNSIDNPGSITAIEFTTVSAGYLRIIIHCIFAHLLQGARTISTSKCWWQIDIHNMSLFDIGVIFVVEKIDVRIEMSFSLHVSFIKKCNHESFCKISSDNGLVSFSYIFSSILVRFYSSVIFSTRRKIVTSSVQLF